MADISFPGVLFRPFLSVIGLALVFSVPLKADESLRPPAPDRVAHIANMVKQDCGSCHGLTLKGGLGPALTPEALADRPDALLVDTIRFGRNNTAMPPWQRFLSEEETIWVVHQLKKGAFLRAMK